MREPQRNGVLVGQVSFLQKIFYERRRSTLSDCGLNDVFCLLSFVFQTGCANRQAAPTDRLPKQAMSPTGRKSEQRVPYFSASPYLQHS